MIRTVNDLRFYLNEDAIANNTPTNKIKYAICLFYCIESCHAYRYLKVLRHCEYHSNNTGLYHRIMYLFYKTQWSRLGFKYNIHIPLNVTGYGLRLVHISGGGMILNANKIGNYCTFNAGVILGNSTSFEAKPNIGDYVVFNPGAKAFGELSIGNNIIVTANAVVTKNVPDNAIVGGIPAKIIRIKD